ncbi:MULTISPECIES: DUF3834 domain-containing protein [Acidiplasma]|jgi:hypothetical protein|uniref:DUF3834 domain-containing protein n=3 Tax=Acidiplasma TaxID=507753 RepID=A0A0Q0VTU9_9ARCH|nr:MULTISPECIES: DUF3834 domain-containing protein [Acidiplasma]KJE48658.1 hypothetical protein TZ01_08430 [Acidiplasma sp. MBA-1]KPV46638.1 hypothetical protein SE19_04665 [Acidiplasma aeolicum]KQB35014.1 hypothetical protein AOG54_09270 [Acidiplasma aeolicum]
MKVIAAPGPVCYPIVAAKMERDDIDIDFQKEGKADIILDSTVSLIKRNLPISYVTIKHLSVVIPKLGYKIGLTRKGGAADILFRAFVSETGKTVEIKYYEGINDLMEAMKKGEIDSAVVPAMSEGGESLEKYFEKYNIYIPGSCGAAIFNGKDKEFIDAYNLGIKILKEKPEEAAKFIVDNLPIKFPPEFIINTMKNSELNVHRPDDYSKFSELVNKYK